MDTRALEKFAQNARRQLLEQVEARLERVLQTDSAELRDQAKAVQQLQHEIFSSSRETVIDRVAYTWFNRFSALRYMDANHYTSTGIVSPAPGHTQPQILQEAKRGYIDEEFAPYVDKQRVFDLLAGRIPSRDGQQEAYRLLLVGACNAYNKVMPFLFEEIDHYTELLMPEDLLSPNSVLSQMREALTEEACQDVEVIGWLYQFYISEKKDEVIGSKKKIQPEDIPAATQLFTPHWIVRYLVENSLGRLWMLNKPGSHLAERMDYYIRPEQEEMDFLRVNSPEELTICDPAVGSGHMLIYAFDLLYAIYEEEGYNPPDIPRLILEKNLVGLEIDERAGALAAFALTMKARVKDRRFLGRGVGPQITVLRPIHIDQKELQKADWFRELGKSLLDLPVQDALLNDLTMLRQVDNIGSLLQPQLKPEQITDLQERISVGTDLFSHALNTQVLDVLAKLEPLAKHYQFVIANPPYMGSRNQNNEIKKYLQSKYKDYKSDLFSAFIVRIMAMTEVGGFIGMMTPFNWMFLSSFEKLRLKILNENTLTNLVRPEFHAFFDSAFVTVCGFTLYTRPTPEFEGAFIDLDDFYGADIQPVKALEAIRDPECGWLYRASAVDFQKIPGSPIAYWLSKQMRQIYEKSLPLSDVATVVCGMTTGDNNQFLRLWHEVNHGKSAWNIHSTEEGVESQKKWFPYNKGGEFRKWYGNNNHLINWWNDGHDVIMNGRAYPRSRHLYFKASLTWSFISSSYFGVRFSSPGFIFDMSGCSAFPINEKDRYVLGSFLCSIIASKQLMALNPTMNYQVGNVASLPWLENEVSKRSGEITKVSKQLIKLSKTDWDNYETSWDFEYSPLLEVRQAPFTLSATYAFLRKQWQEITLEMQHLEEENNRVFIEAYGLQDDLASEVPLAEITLNCNPHYRYRGNKTEAELEALLQADTMREFISYAVGCMVGRYSLDKPGLILANQGDTVDDYYRIVDMAPDAVQFTPDRDNVIPILDGDWFPDDIVGRFRHFLRVTFGKEYYKENLAFIEDALGKDIRKYFLREFYDHHVKMYKKRPIYWLFSSPKGSFNALIYMHRYRPDTVSVILNDYLRDFRAKLEAERVQQETISVSTSATAREKTRADKEIAKLDKILKELREYEDEILYPLAAQQIDIDLDDGVKVNYNKFGKALKRVPGLSK